MTEAAWLGQVPRRLVWEGNAAFVEFVATPEFRPSLPFFWQNVANSGKVARVALADVHATNDEADSVAWPDGFVFHMSRCGSTLVSQMLGTRADALVLGEPEALKDVLRAPAAVSDAAIVSAFRTILGLYATSLRKQGQRLIVKWTSWTVLHLPLIYRAFPCVPACFITRNPVEVMVSLLEKPPGWLRRRGEGVGLHRTGFSRQQLSGERSPEAFAASYLARFCDSASVAPVTVVDYSQLPAAVFDVILPLFGLGCNEAERQKMVQAAELVSKDPGRITRFVGDSSVKHAKATASIRSYAENTAGPALARLRARRALSTRDDEGELASRCKRVRHLYEQGQYLAAVQIGQSSPRWGDAGVVDNASRILVELVAKTHARLWQHGRALDLWQSLRRSAEAGGESACVIARMTSAIGTSQRNLGLLDEAEATFMELLRMRAAGEGIAHSNFGVALNGLATVWHRQGNLLASEQLFRECCLIQRRTVGERHAHFAAALNNLASFLFSCGRFAEAKRLYAQSLECRQDVLGATHPLCAGTLSNLGELYRRVGDLKGSRRHHEAALEIRMSQLGADHYLVGCTRGFLAKVLVADRDTLAARKQLEEAVEILAVCVGQQFPLTQRFMQSLKKLRPPSSS